MTNLVSPTGPLHCPYLNLAYNWPKFLVLKNQIKGYPRPQKKRKKKEKRKNLREDNGLPCKRSLVEVDHEACNISRGSCVFGWQTKEEGLGKTLRMPRFL